MGLEGAGEGLDWWIGGLGGLPLPHAATPQSPPFSHRAAAADLRPTAENIVGEHRECIGASSLQSQCGSAPNGPAGTRRAFEDVASAAQ
jgi:hypothetical protein